MRIVIVGAGVVGVATAYYLSREGHQVEVIESAGIAESASGVNAGLLVPGDSIVWATPKIPALLARSLVGRGESGIALRRSAGPQMISWGLRFLRECSTRRNRANTEAAHRLSIYSYQQLQALMAEEGLDFGHGRNGMVFLFRDRKARDRGVQARQHLASLGEQYELLSVDELIAHDAAYKSAAQHYPYAIYSPSSGHGDCRQFTTALAACAREFGATFHLNRGVLSLQRRSGCIDHIDTTQGAVTGDVYVLAGGSRSARLARTARLRLPIQPAKGYSATVPIVETTSVPAIGGVAEDAHVAYSRTATHLRISSTAEFTGDDVTTRPRAYDSIRRTADLLFGDAVDWAAADYLIGFRPMTPTGLPLIGATPISNLYINAGHSHLGWTQACGSARILSDLIAGRPPAIDPRTYEMKLRRPASTTSRPSV